MWQSTYSFDPNGNVKGLEHSLFGPLNYGYDALDRLTEEKGTAQRKTYSYDATGNRLQRLSYTTNAEGVESKTATQTLVTATTSNRLLTNTSTAITLDAAGNTLQQNVSRVYVYDGQGRLSQVLNPTALSADFTYNALGQRTSRRTYLSSELDRTTTYLYGADVQLLGQVHFNNVGKKTQAQYWIWLEGMPLAGVDFRYDTNGAVVSTNQYYLHADHLNTPRLATSQTQTLQWSWNTDAFGVGLANEDVDGDGIVLDIPLRFPGQMFEAYSALNYNYFRDYDPDTGRYVESDPIGLEGGLNTYGYVGGNPLNAIDSFGLLSIPFPRIWFPALPGFSGLAGLGIPGAVGLACLAYPNNSLAGPQMDDCPGGCYHNEAQPESPPHVPADPTQSPGEGWEWRGRGEPGSREGAWHNPNTGESLHDDRTHPPGKDPHVTYTDPKGKRWDNYGNGWAPQ